MFSDVHLSYCNVWLWLVNTGIVVMFTIDRVVKNCSAISTRRACDSVLLLLVYYCMLSWSIYILSITVLCICVWCDDTYGHYSAQVSVMGLSGPTADGDLKCKPLVFHYVLLHFRVRP